MFHLLLSLIQTTLRVNRTFAGKNKGAMIDNIGIKKQMDLALAQFIKTDQGDVDDIAKSMVLARNYSLPRQDL